MNNKMSNGEALVCTVVFMFVFLLIFGFINEATEPKCIKGGCDNKRAEGSSYCYLHKSYSGSSSHKSKTSSYSNGRGSSSSTSSNKHWRMKHYRHPTKRCKRVLHLQLLWL